MIADRLKELTWDLIPASPQPAHIHMALDEVILGRVTAGARRPTVRFWEWIEPAGDRPASIGSQRGRRCCGAEPGFWRPAG